VEEWGTGKVVRESCLRKAISELFLDYTGGRACGWRGISGLSEPGDNGGCVEGVPTGLSEVGYLSSLTPRAQRKAARVSPRGFCEG
jgi:hypothetical protein